MTKILLTFLALLSIGFSAKSQITWPEGQLLPSFPAPAQTQDLIYLNGNSSDAEKYLFSSLKGLVNLTQPRIVSYEDGDEGAYAWLNSLGIKYNDITTSEGTWALLTKYRSEINGLIVYDPNHNHTVNIATRLAKDYKALIASPDLLPQLTAAPYNFKILLDLRGKFQNKIQIYQYVFDNYWENTDKRILICLPPSIKAGLREYAVALGAAVIWLDPQNADDSALLNRFLDSMPAGANTLGWWPDEQPGITRVSSYGFTTIASDHSTNLTFQSGMPRLIDPHPMLAKPELQNKIYVAFILSDGDNLQYVEHLLRKLWSNPDRGAVPMGWTVSPAMVDAMPGALNYLHRSATDNDNLISGPSGYGYTYPNNWLSNSLNTELANFVAKTEAYNVAAGLRVITVWNTITGGVNSNVGNVYANNAPTLLGITAQNTGGNLAVYANKLPVEPLTCNYCATAQYMKDFIATGASGWNRTSPRFLIIQAQPWQGVTPTSFKDVAASLGSDYVVVRPDQIFQLIREANGLSVNPGGVEGDGTGLTGVYYNGNFETETGTRIDANINFNWGTSAPMADVNPNNFSVRWTGEISPRYTGNYTFYITSSSVARVWIDDQLIINKQTASLSTYTGTISLTAGQKYALKTEYIAGSASALCKLEWASPFQSREAVPQSQLFKDTSSDIKDINVFPDLKVFPNPSTNGVLNIEMNNCINEEKNLTIYDINGSVLLKQPVREAKVQIDVSNFAKGIYLISVRSNNFSKTVKFTISR